MTNAVDADLKNAKNLTDRVAIAISLLALLVSAGSLVFQKGELDQQKEQVAHQATELENQQSELDNQKSELDNQRQELENQEEELSLAREAQEQAANQFEESGAHFRVDTELIGYNSSLGDAVSIERAIRVKESPKDEPKEESTDFTVLEFPDFSPVLYEFSSTLPSENVSMMVTVYNTGRSAGLIRKLNWEVEPEERNVPEEFLCVESGETVKPCTFPLRLEASDASQFIVPMSDFIQSELACVPNKRVTMKVTVDTPDYETYSEILGTEIFTNAPCTS